METLWYPKVRIHNESFLYKTRIFLMLNNVGLSITKNPRGFPFRGIFSFRGNFSFSQDFHLVGFFHSLGIFYSLTAVFIYSLFYLTKNFKTFNLFNQFKRKTYYIHYQFEDFKRNDSNIFQFQWKNYCLFM